MKLLLSDLVNKVLKSVKISVVFKESVVNCFYMWFCCSIFFSLKFIRFYPVVIDVMLSSADFLSIICETS